MKIQFITDAGTIVQEMEDIQDWELSKSIARAFFTSEVEEAIAKTLKEEQIEKEQGIV